jgi:Tfp pilus assembly protein FimT
MYQTGGNMKKNRQKSGQGLVEYVLIVALLALVSVLALTNMGQTVNDGLLSNIRTNLETAENKIKTSP